MVLNIHLVCLCFQQRYRLWLWGCEWLSSSLTPVVYSLLYLHCSRSQTCSKLLFFSGKCETVFIERNDGKHALENGPLNKQHMWFWVKGLKLAKQILYFWHYQAHHKPKTWTKSWNASTCHYRRVTTKTQALRWECLLQPSHNDQEETHCVYYL